MDFQLGPGQYVLLGDNNARSKDSRLSEMDDIPFYVGRDAMIGKVQGRYFP